MEGLCHEKVNILKMWFICGETGLLKGKTGLQYSPDSPDFRTPFRSKDKSNGLFTDVLNSEFPSDLEIICLLKIRP